MKVSLPPEMMAAIHADLSTVKDKSAPIRLYAAAERVRQKFTDCNIALEDIAANFIDLASMYNVVYVIDLADAEGTGALAEDSSGAAPAGTSPGRGPR